MNVPVIILKACVLLLALGIIATRFVEVSSSDSGLWTEHPHSGFCPDSPGKASTPHRSR